MANDTLINDIVLTNGVTVFRNNSVLVNSIGPQYDSSYEANGAKAGSAIRIQTPQEFSVRNTFKANTQDVEQKAVIIDRSEVLGIDIAFTSAEMTQDNVDRFVKNKVSPALATLAANVDAAIYANLIGELNHGVTLPVTSVDRQDILNAGVQLDNGLAPRDGTRKVILNPQAMADVVDSSAGLFNSAPAVSQQYKDGIVSVPVIGFDFGMSQNVSSFTTGARNTAYLVDTAPSEGSTTLSIDTGTGSIKAGDIATIANCFQVNANTKVSTGKLQQFVATADSAGGTVTLTTSPAMISEGPYQNIDSLPISGAAVSFLGTLSTSYPQSLAFHPSFAAVGFQDLSIPRSAAWGDRKSEDGISIRCIEYYDGVNDVESLRFDVLFGSKVIIPRFATRIYSF